MKDEWMRRWWLLLWGVWMAALAGCASVGAPTVHTTGDWMLAIERASGSVQLINTTRRERIARIEGLGDLSHASVVFSRDERFAYVFGRDGGLTQIDLPTQRIAKRIVQSGNSIGGAISPDGRLIAVANYEPGGVNVFDAQTLEPVVQIPAIGADGRRSKVVGLEDAPGQRFVFSLFEAGEIWVADFSGDAKAPQITKHLAAGKQPYDALVSGDGRWYLAGLFGEDGISQLDLWQADSPPKRVLPGYGRGELAMPVYKMPHLEGWAMAGDYAFLPAIGHSRVLVVDARTWKEVAQIDVAGQPVFVMARPDGAQVWVNFAPPNNGKVQVIDVRSLNVMDTLSPGPGVMHLEFSPRGEQLWLSVRDGDEIQAYDTATRKLLAKLPAAKPSGLFMTARAHRIGL